MIHPLILTKVCSKCKGDPKSASEFYKDNQKSTGLSSRCKKCSIKTSSKNREKRGKVNRKQYEKEYYQRTKDKHKTRQNRFLCKNPDWNKFDKIRRLYGLTKSEYNKMMENQLGICKICKNKPATCVDHCHTTKIVRGLLCNSCNSGLGYFTDNITTMNNAIQYIKDSKSIKKQMVDPPSGHKFGFPCELPEGKKYEDLLREKGYPEKDIEFALQYSRYWSESEEE